MGNVSLVQVCEVCDARFSASAGDYWHTDPDRGQYCQHGDGDEQLPATAPLRLVAAGSVVSPVSTVAHMAAWEALSVNDQWALIIQARNDERARALVQQGYLIATSPVPAGCLPVSIPLSLVCPACDDRVPAYQYDRLVPPDAAQVCACGALYELYRTRDIDTPLAPPLARKVTRAVLAEIAASAV